MMNNILCKIGRIGLTDLSRCGLYSSYFYCLRYASSKVNVCRLTNRKIISLSGHDSYKFLQGLITNDVRCLYLPSPSDSQHKSPQDCLFAFVLYPNGRVLADTLIYDFEKTLETNPEDDDGEVSSKSQGSLYIECDDRICERLIKYFKSYKLRKNVTFDRDNSHDIWSLFSAEPTESIESNICQKDGDFIITSDPRLRGHFRILAKQTVPMEHLRETLENKHGLSVSEVSQEDYILHRYRLGIGEGFDDHPDAKCLPLECNIDFLNGINFQKGCYIGQELTARTYHTGVIRKRLVPIQLINPSANDVNNFLDKDFFSTINDKKLGKIRSIHHSHGLGLTYIENLSNEGPIRAYCKSNNSETLELDVFKPTWWPK